MQFLAFPGRWRSGIAAAVVVMLVLAGCGARSALRAPDSGRVRDAAEAADSAPAGFVLDFADLPALEQLDLLIGVDNSNSMRTNQANLMAQFGPLIGSLTNPECVSLANPTPHTCDPANAGDRQVRLPVRDLHVGVVSSDLGTPGTNTPGCPNSDNGDDGLLNPIRHGQSLARHLPWLTAPMGFRPDDCNRVDQFPSFIAFDSGSTDQGVFEHDLRCNAGLYVNGCGLEQQLESLYRAVIWHNASAEPGNTDPNAGFLRAGALLAILLFTDEEDYSVRDCRYARGEPCNDALGTYDPVSLQWASANLNLRAYMYQPGGPQDPTWPLDRYIDPRDPSRGFPGLKPGHPERVVFAAITGVPLELPMQGARTDWNALLGRPDAMNPESFTGRDSRTSVDRMSREGPISMRQANADPSCPDRTVPACRRAGTVFDPSRPRCMADDQYFAWPARRIVEVARRFDESPLCLGRPCHNGAVGSICSNDYSAAIGVIPARIQAQLPSPRCLPRALPVSVDAGTNLRSIACSVRELQPSGVPCAPGVNRTPLRDAMGNAVSVGDRSWCVPEQVPVDADGRPMGLPGHTIGWFYDVASGGCMQRVAYTPGAEPPLGTLVRIECAAP